MPSFWITFEALPSACAVAPSEEAARAICENSPSPIKSIKPLPYPASPRLDTLGGPNFCFQPSRCAGRTSCPQSRSCVD